MISSRQIWRQLPAQHAGQRGPSHCWTRKRCETAYGAQPGGEVHFFEDLYGRDAELEKQLAGGYSDR